MFSRSEKEIEALAGDINSFSFDASSNNSRNPLRSVALPATPSRNKENGYAGTPSPTKSTVYVGDESSRMDIDEPTRNDIDIKNSPKKLPRDFHVKAELHKTQRVVSVCQMYFLDYYCDMFDYVISRRQRTRKVLEYLNQQKTLKSLPDDRLNSEWVGYLEKEHDILRKKKIEAKE